jgi:FkbM family methyltransferase
MLIQFRDIFKKYGMNIKGIIHVGGHYGEEIVDYLNCGIQDIVIFEPISENFDRLKSNVENLNANISGFQVALGSEERETEMFVSSNGALSSSILKPKKHLTQYTDITFNQKEIVDVKTLDSYGYDGYNFINMDVQGYELEVLKGAKKTLEYVDYVYCEVNRDEVYENNAYIEEIDEFLSDYDMVRVETDWQGDTWGDALYIRTKSIDTSKNKTLVHWTSTYDWTQEFFNQHPEIKVGAEIGIAGGQHIKTLLEKTNLEKIYGVDPLESEMWDKSNMGSLNVQKEYGGFDNLYQQIVNMLKPYGDRCEIIRDTSVSASDQFEDESLDFVFIDAIHDYENCFADISAWQSKVKRGGYIMGHDWEHENYPEVQRAVEEYFKNDTIIGITGPTHVWYVEKK